MLFQWPRGRVKPVRSAEVIPEIVVKSHFLDSEIDDGQTHMGSQLQFAQDLFGTIRIR